MNKENSDCDKKDIHKEFLERFVAEIGNYHYKLYKRILRKQKISTKNGNTKKSCECMLLRGILDYIERKWDVILLLAMRNNHISEANVFIRQVTELFFILGLILQNKNGIIEILPTLWDEQYKQLFKEEQLELEKHDSEYAYLLKHKKSLEQIKDENRKLHKALTEYLNHHNINPVIKLFYQKYQQFNKDKKIGVDAIRSMMNQYAHFNFTQIAEIAPGFKTDHKQQGMTILGMGLVSILILIQIAQILGYKDMYELLDIFNAALVFEKDFWSNEKPIN